ncbi:MAG: galactose oxidase early set domain-containing protein, partial [Flavobacterium sp.]
MLNDGKIFVSSLINGFNLNIKINPFDGMVQEVSPLPNGAYHGFGHPSVLLPLSSSDNYAARILLCGGDTSQVINLSDVSPNWTTVLRDGNPTGTIRDNSCATLLPTGQVVLTGGVIADDTGQTGVNNPEIYDSVTGQWTTVNDPASVLRNYHSSALLMPDATIWTGGGNSSAQPGAPPTADQKKIEIYTPPYPAGTRPIILSCPRSATYGKTIEVVTDNGEIITKVVLMRCGSSTHAYNPDQRAINLDFTKNGNTINAAIPANPNVAIPGHYMFFTIDNDGRPCQYAKFVRIGHQHCEIITDRSTFSVKEVDAQPPANA